MSELYNIEDKGDYSVYSFDEIDLKIKCVENKNNVNVYIKYKEHNPLFSMLFGGFNEDCDLYSIGFEVQSESRGKYAVVSKEKLEDFIEEAYFFIWEHRAVLDKIPKDMNRFMWEI